MIAILYLHNRRQSKRLVLSGTMRFISVLVLQGRDSGMEELCEMIEKDLSQSTTRLHAVNNDNQSSRQSLVCRKTLQCLCWLNAPHSDFDTI